MKLKNQMESINIDKNGSNELTIIYKIDKEEQKVKIFGSNFVKNNIHSIKLIKIKSYPQVINNRKKQPVSLKKRGKQLNIKNFLSKLDNLL